MTRSISVLTGLKALSIAASLALAPLPAAAASPDVAQQVSQQLKAQGYGQIEVRRTLLGKLVITAEGHGHKREIVIDPRNGALLRDLVRDADGGRGGVSIARVGDDDDDNSGPGGGSDDDDDNSGSGGGGGDDDDGSDDDSSNDDSDSDDSSGSGGGDDDDDDSSGSGSGGDDSDRDDD